MKNIRIFVLAMVLYFSIRSMEICERKKIVEIPSLADLVSAYIDSHLEIFSTTDLKKLSDIGMEKILSEKKAQKLFSLNGTIDTTLLKLKFHPEQLNWKDFVYTNDQYNEQIKIEEDMLTLHNGPYILSIYDKDTILEKQIVQDSFIYTIAVHPQDYKIAFGSENGDIIVYNRILDIKKMDRNSYFRPELIAFDRHGWLISLDDDKKLFIWNYEKNIKLKMPYLDDIKDACSLKSIDFDDYNKIAYCKSFVDIKYDALPLKFLEKDFTHDELWVLVLIKRFLDMQKPMIQDYNELHQLIIKSTLEPLIKNIYISKITEYMQTKKKKNILNKILSYFKRLSFS